MHTEQMGPQAQPGSARGGGVAVGSQAAGFPTVLPPRPRARGLPARTQQQQQQQQLPARQPQRRQPIGLLPAILGAALRLPVLALRTSVGLVAASVTLGLGVAAFVGDRVLPAPIMRSVRGERATKQ
jgi:hypothetical protein